VVANRATDTAHGALHPIVDPGKPWEAYPGLVVWMAAQDPAGVMSADLGPFVALEESATGDTVVIPAARLAAVGRALLAAHVDAGRDDKWIG
jgi:hypothetical protein